MTDNGPQYTSCEFSDFAFEWKFRHFFSLPHHSRFNSKLESAVKVVRSIFKKAISDNKEPWLALLDYRDALTEGIQTSPCQYLMSGRSRTVVPVFTNLLYLEVVRRVPVCVELKSESYPDNKAKLLSELDIGH